MIKFTPNKSLDPNYNYLSDAMDNTGKYIYKGEDYKFCSKEHEGCMIKATINEKCYRDPDAYSNRLYNDLSLLTGLLFVDGKDSDYKGEYKYKHMEYSGIPFTSDYIGASKYWIQNKGFTESEIGKMLESTRKIGGHMIWPSVSKKIIDDCLTINTARGGAKGVYDRFDMTLSMIKNYYTKEGYRYNDRVFVAILNEHKLFDEYESGEDGFKNFIDAFLLNDFVDNNYDVLSLVYNKPLQKDEKVTSILESRSRLDAYVQNSIDKINKRTNRICGL